MQHKWEIGIDEVGRGPLAGPVAIGVVKIPVGFDWNSIPGVTDSKKLTPEKRAVIFRTAQHLRHYGHIDFTVAQVGASVIDERGISFAIRLAMARAIARLKLCSHSTSFRLDGSLYAPAEFTQATIIKGDALYPEIGLASIVAKETRDGYMRRIHRRYHRYGFADHMGYGTVAHRAAIKQYGLSPIHRVSYCKNVLS